MCKSGGSKNEQKNQPPPPTPAVKETGKIVQQVKRNTQVAQSKRKGAAATLLAGETGGAETRQKTLLGGG